MIYKIYRDIVNYFAIRKIVKRSSKSVDWEKHQLRVDWVYRIYTVVNPTKYEIGDDPIVLKQKMLEKTYPINAYIDKLGISDLVAASWEPIPNSNAYLLVYYPIFNYLTVWKVTVFTFFLLVGSIMAYLHFC